MRVIHTLDGLQDDLTGIAKRSGPELSKAVRTNVREGVKLAKTFAKGSAGPHGKAYHKRISGEMTGALSGEFGPTGDPKTEFVGAGFRHGRNTDLPRTADIIGPKLADDVDRVVDGWFW